MIRKLGEIFTRWSEKIIPDPFVLALLLTLIALVAGAGRVWSHHHDLHKVFDLLAVWSSVEFWKFLEFAMQIVLVLVTGHAVAAAPVVSRFIDRLAHLPRNSAQCYFLVAFTAALAGLIHWGLALVVGGFLAKEVGKEAQAKGLKVHYPLLGAAAYLGLLVWHGGLSGSAPLLVATQGHFLQAKMGIVPLSQTLFSPMNLTVSAILLVAIPGLFVFMHPRAERVEDYSRFAPYAMDAEEAPPAVGNERGLGPWLNRAAWLNYLTVILAVLGMAAAIRFYGFKPGINFVNFVFLILGLIFHKTPLRYMESLGEGARASAPIIIQFPFYAGIAGIISHSGLLEDLSGFILSFSTARTYPVITYVLAGLVNFFVPSGGGQWGVQGELAVEAAKLLGASLPKTVMAVAYGDQSTNLVQPFWALPIMGIMGLKAEKIVGYCAVASLAAYPIFLIFLLF